MSPLALPSLKRIKVSTARPVFVRHASGHLATVNTALLQAEGITKDTPTPGVVMDPDGEPNGELQEAPAMMLAKGAFEKMMAAGAGARPIQIHAAMCRNAGVTTSTELVGMLLIDSSQVAVWQDTVNDAAFPVRMVLYNLPTMPGSTARVT